MSAVALQIGSGRITLNHLAYLRALAQGLPMARAAFLYLGIQHGAEALNAHKLVVERVAAVARRQRDPRWRLIGLAVEDSPAKPQPPSLYEWAEAEGLDGWSEEELLEVWVERFGAQQAGDGRRQARNERLRAGRLALLRELERVASAPAKLTDLLEGWLVPELAEQLRRLGLLTLADLQARIRIGGRWWRGIHTYGPVKAGHLATYLASLVGPPEAPLWKLPDVDPSTLDGSRGALRADGVMAIAAGDDRVAIDAWVKARAGTPATSRSYRREAERFLLWMILERKRALSDTTVEDCSAYLDFLQDVPERWISRGQASRFAPGWAPFRGPLGIAARALAVAALHSLFGWLVQVRYLALNPWAAVNRKLGDDPDAELDVDQSRAFTVEAWAALLEQLEREPAGLSRARLRWLLHFMEATGLRSSELLVARRAHLIERRGAWFLRVRGKGRKNRLVTVPSAAVAATREFFSARGIELDSAPDDTPLIATRTGGPLSYSALYETFTRFVRRALKASRLPEGDRRHAAAASAHWLRHTHATRAAERDVPLDVLQDSLGQEDPRTTGRYYRAQVDRRRAAMEKAFGEGRG